MRLVRVWDDEGAVCQLPEVPDGRVFDAVSGRELVRGTKAWSDVVTRLGALVGPL